MVSKWCVATKFNQSLGREQGCIFSRIILKDFWVGCFRCLVKQSLRLNCFLIHWHFLKVRCTKIVCPDCNSTSNQLLQPGHIIGSGRPLLDRNGSPQCQIRLRENAVQSTHKMMELCFNISCVWYRLEEQQEYCGSGCRFPQTIGSQYTWWNKGLTPFKGSATIVVTIHPPLALYNPSQSAIRPSLFKCSLLGDKWALL